MNIIPYEYDLPVIQITLIHPINKPISNQSPTVNIMACIGTSNLVISSKLRHPDTIQWQIAQTACILPAGESLDAISLWFH